MKSFTKYDTMKEAKKAAEEYRFEESKKNNRLTNRIRYIDKDTIDYALLQYAFITDDSLFSTTD